MDYISTCIFIVVENMPCSSLNTSYVSLKRLVRTKFPEGIAQHREIQRTANYRGNRYREGEKAKRSIACNPFDANPTIRRFPEADVDGWEFCAKHQRL